MAKKKSSYNQRKQRQLFRSIVPFMVVIGAISGLIIYLWIYSEVDESLRELEIQQMALVELNDEFSNLHDDIEYLSRVDILTSRAADELGMVFTTPETVLIYVDGSKLIDN